MALNRKKELFKVPPVVVQCAYELCVYSAICQQRTKTGWANLCHHHYVRYAQDIADAYCRENNLNTWKEKQVFRQDRINLIGNPKLSPVEHWRKVINNEMTALWAKMIAIDALAKLTQFEPENRVPGEDDE